MMGKRHRDLLMIHDSAAPLYKDILALSRWTVSIFREDGKLKVKCLIFSADTKSNHSQVDFPK